MFYRCEPGQNTAYQLWGTQHWREIWPVPTQIRVRFALGVTYYAVLNYMIYMLQYMSNI